MIKNATMATLALALSAAPVMASEPAQSERQSVCGNVGKVAGGIMVDRQNGVTAQVILERFKGNHPMIQQLAERLVLAAFQRSRYPTASYRQEEVTEFSSQWFTKCLRGEVIAGLED